MIVRLFVTIIAACALTPVLACAAPTCSASLPTGPKFVQLLQTVVSHADITDIAFLEDTLGLHFELQPSEDVNGISDTRTRHYLADRMYGTQASIDLTVQSDRKRQQEQHSIAYLRINDSVTGDALSICSHFTSADVVRRFGDNFAQGLATDGAGLGGASKRLTESGKGGSVFVLGYSYRLKDGLVTGVGIEQIPGP